MGGEEGRRARRDQEIIFVDANIFLSFIVSPVTPRDSEMRHRSEALFGAISDGTVMATTTGVVLHEVCWVLGAKSRYAVPTPVIVDIMMAILGWPGWVMTRDDVRVYFRALEIFAREPRLEYSDSLVAARSEALGATLATFDRRLAKAYSGLVWE
jgi:predicted nucleic acid-binding protein